MALILIYSVHDKNSIENLNDWRDEIELHGANNINILLVANVIS